MATRTKKIKPTLEPPRDLPSAKIKAGKTSGRYLVRALKSFRFGSKDITAGQVWAVTKWQARALARRQVIEPATEEDLKKHVAPKGDARERRRNVSRQRRKSSPSRGRKAPAGGDPDVQV